MDLRQKVPFFINYTSGYLDTVTGNGSVALPKAKANGLKSVKLFGGTEQTGTPTPDNPIDIICNNGALKLDYTSKNLNVGTLDNQGYTSTGGTSSSTTFCGTLWKIKVSEGEKYTISYGDFPDGISGVFVNTWKTDGTWNLRQAISIGSSYTYTIPSGVGAVNFTLYKTGGITIGSNSWMQVEKGETATAYVPAGYSLQTKGTVETVQVHGINIFDKNDTENIGVWYSGSNQTITQANANETLVMRAKPNTTYYFKHCSVKGGCRAFYTEVEDWEIGSPCSTMSGNAGANANAVYSITTSANAKWIFFNCGRNNVEASFDDQRNDFMVSTSELTSDTPYEPYFNGGSATAEMLLRLDGAVDEQEILTGALIRNVKVIVFDGTEPFTASTAYGKACIIQNAAGIWGANRDVAPVCTHFLGESRTSGSKPDYTCFFNATGHFYFRLEDNTVATFKAWLAAQYAAGTPVMLLVAAAEPTTETVTGQTLQTQAGTNILQITQASIDNLPLEAAYKRGK